MAKKLLFTLMGISGLFYVNAQKYIEMRSDPNATFYDIQKEFYEYWNNKITEDASLADPEAGEQNGYNQFKRWEWYMENRIDPATGKMGTTIPFIEYQKYLASKEIIKQTYPSLTAASWQPLGPTNVPATGVVHGGAGRCNFVKVHPTNSNIIYTGSPTGGVWKTTNGGNTWTTATDQLGSIGVTDMAIDKNNPNTLYLATGDGDNSSMYSIGVLKSTDAGATWNTTGLTWDYTYTLFMNRVIVSPSNSNIVIAGAANGIHRSTDAGTNWTHVYTTATNAGTKDMEFNIADANIVYSAHVNGFFRSTDAGATWTKITSGLPTAGFNRWAVAVTPADANVVYVLVGSATNHFVGLYKSTDGGLNFTAQSNGSGTGGSAPDIIGNQSSYDMALAVSQTNVNEVFVGGISIWKSTDGGVNWNQSTQWTSSGSSYVHADCHALEYINSSTIITGVDGGVFYSTNNGSTWNDLSDGLQIAEIYNLAISQTNASLILTGHQDNGINRYNGSWTACWGGDGMNTVIDPNNNNNFFGANQNGALVRNLNGGTGIWSNMKNNITETGGWTTPLVIDPQSSTLYTGYTNVWRSTDKGSSWTKSIPLSISGTIVGLAISDSDPNTLYCIKAKNVLKSTNGGVNWTNVTANLSTTGASLFCISIHPTDPNHIYIGYSGYVSGKRIYETTNGGTSWTDISAGLPALPINCIAIENNANGGVYIGMDIGCYYKNKNLSSWIPYSSGLPNTFVADLKIHTSTGKLKAATYGRGVWEVDLAPTNTGINEGDWLTENQFNAYPNPTHDELNISFTASEKNNYVIELSNAVGQNVFCQNLNDFIGSYTYLYNMINLSKGTYTLVVRNNTRKSVRKIIYY